VNVLVSAGDASGELHAAGVVEELARRRADLAWSGLGGPALARAGVTLHVAQRELAIGGFLELARDLPRVAGAWRRMTRALAAERPRLALLVDSPDFNLPLARRAKRLGVPVLYFIAPQVWAWRRGRARTLAQRADRLAVILPFEKEAFAGTGLRVDFVGHPLVERLAGIAAREPRALRRSLGLADERPLVALFPGSRRNEIAANLPLQLAVARALHALDPRIQFALAVAPSLEAGALERAVGAARLPSGLDLALVAGEGHALARCADAALSKPGTVTLELALLGTPQLVAARVPVWTALALRRLVSVRWWALPNLIAGEELVPELLQEAARPQPIAEALLRLVGGPEGAAQRAALARVRQALGAARATARVADIVEEMLGPARA
jgi:lipid-A-disaccharide synthase